MPKSNMMSRRGLLALTGSTAAGALAADATPASAPSDRTFRIGVISAAIHGKPQTRNGHTWHFAQYLHPVCDLAAMKRVYPYALDMFTKVTRNPRCNFDQLPFPDTRITHYYDADPKSAAPFAEVFPGVVIADNLEKMVQEVDAIWLGDASGYGEDHFDLIAPGLARGLPTFCDKPIGGTVAGTRKILEFAAKHQTPIMSASIFRYEHGMETALRMRDSGEFGPIEHVSARLYSRYKFDNWMIYGQHPVWTVMTLMGAGVDGVSLYEYNDTCHGLITYADRYPCHVWYGMPAEKFEYDRADIYFHKKQFSYTPSIEGDFLYGHHYQMFRMAATFRQMLKTRVEPVPHKEILEVTACIHAGAKSLKEQNRTVKLAEVMG